MEYLFIQILYVLLDLYPIISLLYCANVNCVVFNFKFQLFTPSWQIKKHLCFEHWPCIQQSYLYLLISSRIFLFVVDSVGFLTHTIMSSMKKDSFVSSFISNLCTYYSLFDLTASPRTYSTMLNRSDERGLFCLVPNLWQKHLISQHVWMYRKFTNTKISHIHFTLSWKMIILYYTGIFLKIKKPSLVCY